MLCIFSMHFENVPALQSLINQILLYSYRKVCAHFLIQLFDLSERRRSAGKKGLQGRRNRGSKEGPCPPGFHAPSPVFDHDRKRHDLLILLAPALKVLGPSAGPVGL